MEQFYVGTLNLKNKMRAKRAEILNFPQIFVKIACKARSKFKFKF